MSDWIKETVEETEFSYKSMRKYVSVVHHTHNTRAEASPNYSRFLTPRRFTRCNVVVDRMNAVCVSLWMYWNNLLEIAVMRSAVYGRVQLSTVVRRGTLKKELIS